MRIVHQSAADSYSVFPFLVSPAFWLPAPSIAGLLPAPLPATDPPPKADAVPFTYSSPYVAELSEAQREAIYDTARALIDVAVEYERGTLSDHAVLTAIMLYRQTLSKEPIDARNPAEFNALMDTPILQFLVEQARRHAARRESHAITLDLDTAVDHD